MDRYQGKHIVIIGGGLLQVPAIRIANEIGLRTIVTDYNPQADGMKICDYPVEISTRDVDGTVRKLREFNEKIKIDGIFTVGTDASMTVSAVANALGLPGIEFKNAEAASNKYKMRQRFREHGVPIPQFYQCWSYKDLEEAAAKLGYPFVLKPTDNMGARGVMKIESEEFLMMAFNNAKKSSPIGELIAEEYMDGPELSIDALVYNNEVFITGVADRIIEREPFFIETGHVMPSALPQPQIDDAVNVFKQGIKALGINLGAAKGDIKVTSKGAKVGEIAARLSGGFMSAYTFPYSSGVNLIKNAIDIALGYPPGNLNPTRNWVSIENAIIPEPGIIEEITGLEEAYEIPGVKNIFFHAKTGDEVKEPTSNVEKSGNFIVVTETREEAWETVRKVHETIQIKTRKKSAYLKWSEIRHQAREKLNRSCLACPVCNGIECKGRIPGVGGIGNGMAFIRNVEDLSKILIETRSIHTVKHADTSIEFLGIKLALPFAAAPITGCDINLGGGMTELEYDIELIEGCKLSGIIGFVGDGAQPFLYKTGIEALRLSDGYGGIIYKPRENEAQIQERLDAATQARVRMAGLDVDAAAFITMELMGQKVETKTREQLKKIVSQSRIPFIIKGIMTVEDALEAIESGAKAIVVSNHGGRITENHPSSISVLKKIADAVKGKIKIIFDGGIRSGEDIFKAIALGADLVMAGRPFTVAVFGAGRDGVVSMVEQYKKELQKIMVLTGAEKIESITEKSLIIP